MATQSTTTIDFGSAATDVTTAVAAPTITGSQLVEVWIFPAVTASNTVDNHWVDDIHVMAGNVQNGVGFTLYASCKTGFAHGVFNIAYVFN